MTRLFTPEDSFDPRDNFVGTGVRGLVEIDESAVDVIFHVSFQRGATAREGGVVVGAGVQPIEVLI